MPGKLFIMTETRELQTDELIRASEAARLIHVTTRTLDRWSDSGLLPEPVRLGMAGLKHYYRSDIDRLLKNQGHANG
jgi:predicted DNA-binding transcriptional regulator AlpA